MVPETVEPGYYKLFPLNAAEYGDTLNIGNPKSQVGTVISPGTETRWFLESWNQAINTLSLLLCPHTGIPCILGIQNLHWEL